MTADGGAGRRSPGLVDAGLLVLAASLSLLTVAVVATPVSPAIINDRLDLAIVTTSMLVAGAVAAVDWSRGRLARDGSALLRGSAFTILAVFNLLTLGVLLLDLDTTLGASFEQPGQLPIVASVLARGTAAALLVAAGAVALRGAAIPARPVALLVGPALAVTVVILAAAAFRDRLPVLAPEAALGSLGNSPSFSLPPGSAPGLVLVQAVIALAFLAAALLTHRSYRRTGRLGTALLAAGMLVAAFSQAHGAIHPGGYGSAVTSGDLLRLGFYGFLLAGIVADRRADLAELRRASVEVRRLAEAELATAALAERARLAREIHDGLAQDLWYAKLKQSRLAQLAAFEGETEQLSTEVGDAIDAALSEARNAVAAMREGAEVGPLLEMLERHVNDFADRFALRVEFTAEGPAPDIGPRQKAEILRILQEALTNVRKHADATIVRVAVHSDGTLRLSVADNGRGFRTEQAPAGFGLDSMRQRAEVIGASLVVTSEPRNGTRVELTMANEKEGTDADAG